MQRYATIDADPYPWPYDGNLRPDNTALVGSLNHCDIVQH